MINDKRYYTLNEEVNFDEDLRHEFKNHLSFTNDNISAMSKKLRLLKPISQSINAILNSGMGGTIYLGIRDCGNVQGHLLTEYQRDHVQLCLEELLKRYQPAVPRSWINVEFIRVVETDAEFEWLLKDKTCFIKGRLKPHSLGCVCCWCHLDAKDRIHNNVYVPSFVIEITIKSWDPYSDDNENLVPTTKTKLHPIFEDEHGDVWMRRLAGNRKYTKEEIFEITMKEVEEYYMTKP